MELAFVDRKQPLLIFGKTGTGKTHIAAALGSQACQIGFKVRFFSLQNLLAMLYTSLADESTDEVVTSLSRFDLLIIDNVGSIRTKRETSRGGRIVKVTYRVKCGAERLKKIGLKISTTLLE